MSKEIGKFTQIFFLSLIIVCFLTKNSSAQKREPAHQEVVRIADVYDLQPRKLIDCPTAGLLPRGSFDFDIRVYPQGGVITAVNIGLMNRFMIGVSFGGENVFGEGSPNWNPKMEFAARLRLIEETYSLPAFAFGFDSQGAGAWDDSLERYTYKSKGFYAVLTKSYLVAETPVGFHGGVNYSLEHKKDKDENISLFFGFDAQIANNLGLVVEYDLATNDDKKLEFYGKGYGYLNAGINWTFANRLQLEFQLKNILKNRKDISTLSRELRIVYVEFF